MGDSFQAEGEIQFQYNSLKYSFQEFIPEHSTSPEPTLPDLSSDDIIPDPALPEHIPDHPEPVPLPYPPNPPAHHPHQHNPHPPPSEPSAHIIKPTEKGDASCFQKAGPSNSVP